MSMHANASRVDGPFREDTPRPSPTYSPGSESPASDDGRCAPPAAGRAASGSTACSPPTIGPTDDESETPMDVETPVGSGTESGDEREDDPTPPKGVAAHRADAAQAVRSALREVWQGLSSDGLFVVITPKFELLEGFFAHCSNIWVLDSVKKLGCGGSGSAAVGQGAAPRQGVSAKTPAAAMMTFRAVGKPPRRAQPPSRPVYA